METQIIIRKNLSIPKIIELGLECVITTNVIIGYMNQSKTFGYHNGEFRSYNEIIGFHTDDTFYVYGKTAKYGHFFSPTTSKHVGWLMLEVRNHTKWKDNWKLIDINGNIIGNKKDKGKKYTGEIECPICYDKFSKGIILKCNHKFCKSCIGKWLKTNTNCPYCKSSIYV